MTSSNMPRIASEGRIGDRDTGPIALETSRQRPLEKEPRVHVWESSRSNFPSRDTPAYDKHQNLAYGSSQPAESRGRPVGATPSPSFYNESTYQQKQPDLGRNATSIHNFQSSGVPAGRRPNGARLPSPPPSNVSTFDPTPARSGKARLNLLNPMSLLARRRTSHAIPPLAPEALTSSKSKQQETLDFRIRGTVVHDFSAPRPRRNVSYGDGRAEENSSQAKTYQRSPMPDSNGAEDNSSPRWSGGNHTPVFTENFEEEQYPAAGPHVRKADDLSDLTLPRPPYAQGATRRPIEVDTPPQNSSDSTSEEVPAAENTNSIPAPNRPPPVPPKAGDGLSIQNKHISIDSSLPLSKPSVSSQKSRPRKVSEVSVKSIKDAALPKHMKSTSSRFSFDMIGAAKQERLLEDRHRQKALEKQNERGNDDDNYGGFDEEYDFDGMDDDDGLEERIPGVNTDLEDENDDIEDFLVEEEIPLVGEDDFDEEIPSNAGNLGGFTFQQSLLTPLSPSSPGMAETPRDFNGEVIGFAMTRNSPFAPSTTTPHSATYPLTEDAVHDGVSNPHDPQGLGLQGLTVESPPKTIGHAMPDEQVSIHDFGQQSRSNEEDEDDLYFDDGLIGGLDNEEDVPEFDESVFDRADTDQYGRPLKSFSPEPTLYQPPMVAADRQKFPEHERKVQEDEQISDNLLISKHTPRDMGLAPQTTVTQRNFDQPAEEQLYQGLTQDTLAAYQSALAAAAFSAAANGKFRRDSLPGNPVQSDPEDTQPGLMTDSNQTSHYEPFSPNYELDDDFDYDDVLEDDDIIAAANAEALAYDADGFYGQEFGFYSAPAAAQGEYANGGYFGPRGDGINRAQSGRIVVREPNLTPITERSEYSNRNSFMSSLLSPSGHGAGSVTSPGLAQLAGMMSAQDYEGGDMSLNALLKLRRGAWGGSQASLHSSTGSPKSAGGPDDINPASHPPWAQGGSSSATGFASQGHRRKNSAISAISEATSANELPSDDNSIPGSPTLTMNASTFTSTRKEPEHENWDKENDPLQFRRHKHSASAESISYLQEDDPVGGQRWILERRRTAESGEGEVLGREVVQGGRI
jgi:hypothetical protein